MINHCRKCVAALDSQGPPLHSMGRCPLGAGIACPYALIVRVLFLRGSALERRRRQGRWFGIPQGRICGALVSCSNPLVMAPLFGRREALCVQAGLCRPSSEAAVRGIAGSSSCRILDQWRRCGLRAASMWHHGELHIEALLRGGILNRVLAISFCSVCRVTPTFRSDEPSDRLLSRMFVARVSIAR